MHRIKSIGKKQLVSLVTLAVVVVLIISTVILYYFVGQPVNVIVVGKTSDISIQFWQDLHEGFDVAAKEFGVDYKFLAPPTEQDIDTQISLLNYAVSQKPDVIILIAADHTRLKQAAQNVVDNHIGLITLDSDVDIDPGDKTFVSTDNFAAGQTAGREMAHLVGNGKKVAVISHVSTASTAIGRDAGFRNGYGGGFGSVPPTLYCNTSRDKAFELTYQLLLENPEICGIVGLNEFSTLGACDAIRYLGLSKKVAMVGFDSSLDEVKLLEEGVISSIVIQQPFNMGYLAMKAAYDKARGATLGPAIYTDHVLITKENMFEKENQKLLFQFKK